MISGGWEISWGPLRLLQPGDGRGETTSRIFRRLPRALAIQESAGPGHSWICSAKPHLPQPSSPASYNQKENERYWLSGGNHNEAQKLANTTSRSCLQIIYLYSRSKYSLYSKFCCYTYECTSSSTCMFLCAIIYILWTSVSETLLFFSTLLINRGSFVLNN